MLGSLPSTKRNLGAPLQSRKAMLETLFRHLAMVRLSVGAVVLLTLASCTGLIDGAGDGLTSQERTARKKWSQQALPVLRDACETCHAGSRPAIDFMKPESGDLADELGIRDRIRAYQPVVVNTDAPSSARLVSKGLHDGPPLTLEQAAKIVDWMQSERDSETHAPGATTKLLATAPFAVLPCTAGLPDNAAGTCPTNHVPLTDVADVAKVDIPGAEIAFNATVLDSGMYLTNLKLNGGTAGAYIEHPLFVSRPEKLEAFPDQLDRYFAAKVNSKPGGSALIGGGADAFIGFGRNDMVEIHFKKVGLYTPDTGPPPANTGCRVIASFMTNAAAAIQNACGNCHAGSNPGATNAMDITGATSTDLARATVACNQIRTRVNLTNTATSSIYLAPDPGSATSHPFKFNPAALFTTYKTSVDLWVQAEKIAP
jgi:hypothetical protein